MPVIKNTYSTPSTLKGIGNFNESQVITNETDIENIIKKLNEYINNVEEDDIDKSNWKTWSLDKEGNPIFSE